MSLYKQKTSVYWWYAIRNGKKYLRGSTGTKDRDIAEAVAATIRSALKQTTPADRLHEMIDALTGKSRKQDGLPLAGIWQAYEQHIKTTGKLLSESTIRSRRKGCENFAAWAKESYPASDTAELVDRACAARYASFLASKGTKNKTRKNVIGELSAVWAMLQRTRNEIKENPWRLVAPEASNSERGKAFTPEQERAVVAAADNAGNGWGLACRIARHTGLRYGDVARLRWDAIDLDACTISTVPAKTMRHKIVVKIPISAELLIALRAARAADPAGIHVLPEHAECYPQPANGLPRTFRESVLAPAGIDNGYTFHSWRHTFRTRLAEAGVADEIAKRLGGWTEDATAARYDHASRLDAMREAVEAAARVSVG